MHERYVHHFITFNRPPCFPPCPTPRTPRRRSPPPWGPWSGTSGWGPAGRPGPARSSGRRRPTEARTWWKGWKNNYVTWKCKNYCRHWSDEMHFDLTCCCRFIVVEVYHQNLVVMWNFMHAYSCLSSTDSQFKKPIPQRFQLSHCLTPCSPWFPIWPTT